MDRIDNSTVEQSRHKFLPPKPELSHLTEEELSIIRNVLKKQENFEKDIEKSTRYRTFNNELILILTLTSFE